MAEGARPAATTAGQGPASPGAGMNCRFICLLIWLPALTLMLAGCTTGKPGTTNRSYSVYAETKAGFARSVRTNAPRGGRAFGLVQITFHPDYKLVADAKGCRATVQGVGLELVIILPKWRDGKPVPAPVERHWKRFSRTIGSHEKTHVGIARTYAERMRKSIAALRSKTGCGHLASLIKKQVVQIKAQHLRAHERFDLREKKRLKRLL